MNLVSNIVITIIKDEGFENVAMPKIMLSSLNNELEKGPTTIHFETRSIPCYGYIIHAKGAKNQLLHLGREGESSE